VPEQIEMRDKDRTQHILLRLPNRQCGSLFMVYCLLLSFGLFTGCDQPKPGTHPEQLGGSWENGGRNTSIEAVYDSLAYYRNQKDSIGLDTWVRKACTPQRTEEGWKGCCAAGQGMAASLQEDFRVASTAFVAAAGHFESAGKWQLQGRSLNNLATAYQKLNLVNESRNARREAIRLFTNHAAAKADSIWLVQMLSSQMDVEIQTDYYSQALQYAQQGLNLAQLMRDTAYCVFFLENMANIQVNFGEQDMAKANLRQALELLTHSSEKYELSIIRFQLELSSTPEEAQQQLEAYHQLANKKGFPIEKQANFWYSYAIVMEQLGQYESAYTYFQKTVAATKDEEVPSFAHLWSRINVSTYLLKKGQYKAVLEQLPYILALAKSTQDGQMQLNLLNQYSQALAHTGQKDSAYHFLREMVTLQDSIKKTSNEKDFMRIHMSQLFEQEKEILALQQAQERQASEAQIAQQRLLLGVGGLGLLLLGALAFAFYRNFRIKQRAADALAQANATLAAEQDKLRRSNDKLRRFSGVVSHDILSNLDLILSTGNVLVGHQPKQENLSQYYSLSQRTSRQLKDYCLGLLEEARSAVGSVGRVSNPMPIVEAVLARQEIALLNKGCKVSLEPLSPTLLPPSITEQVFQNLISNALRYGLDAAEPCLRIAEEQAPLGGKLRWVVEDNGPGASPSLREAIFDKTSAEGIDSQGQNLGLGLLRETLKGYGAQIWVEETLGGGARFVVELEEREEL
jgi:signal transduction histidine kinase